MQGPHNRNRGNLGKAPFGDGVVRGDRGGVLLALRGAPGPTRAGWGRGLTALLGVLTLAAVPFAAVAYAADQPLAVWGAAAAFAGLALVILLGAPSAGLALAVAGQRL